MESKRILIIIQMIRRGGVELVALNFARSLKSFGHDVSFLLINPDEHNDDELMNAVRKEGFEIYTALPSADSYFKKYLFLAKFFKEHSFDAVHTHVMFFSGLVSAAAKRAGIKHTAAHSHASKWNRKENLKFKIYKLVMRFLINSNASELLACSVQAGEYLYGKKAFSRRGKVILNGIDCKKFAFNSAVRNEKRKELNVLNGEILAGHVGTLYYVKNQTFLLDVFSEMLKLNSEAKLVLVGEDVDGDILRAKARRLGINDKVIFAGQVSDVERFMQAMDILIFPSLFEAFPLSLVEAQASNLPCLISDSVTKSVKINSNVEFLPLSQSAGDWAQKAVSLLSLERKEALNKELEKSYDINSCAKALENAILGI